MKNKIIFILIFTLIILNCAGSLPTMKEPVQGKNLIIGSIIFENSGYQNRNDVYFSNIEVAVIGLYKKNGKEKIFGKWIASDKNGYFFIPNVPDGKYALKALRVNMAGQAFLTISNDFRSMMDNYKIQPNQNVAFSGSYFDIQPNNRIINLKNNYFTILPNSEIRYGAYDKIREFQASSGEQISRPLIFKYFMETYPESGWSEYLKTILDTFK